MSTRLFSTLPRLALVAAATSLSFFAWAPDASACACCADPGQRIETTAAMQPYEKAELERIRFAKVAKLYMNAGGPDNVTGVTDPAGSYEVVQARQGDVWTFTFKDAKGKTGALSFTLPAKLESFFVDIHDGQQAGGNGPLLYKEWRVGAALTATGIFKPGMTGGPTVRLVLQGRGNSCTQAEQFSWWTLVVSGPKAQYELYGSLAAPAP
jgi:hypothetical protein